MIKNFYIIDVKGNNINRFIDKCKINNINLYKIKYISYKNIIVKIKKEDYNKLLKIKSIYKINIINKKGLIKLKELVYNYKLFLIVFVIGIMFLLFLSNITFKVNIISNNKELIKKIEKELNYYGIKKYSFSKNYNDIQKIKLKILKKYKNNIEWLEIERNGVVYNIQIVERKKSKSKKIKNYTNVVANKSGVIKKIFVEEGVKVVENDTYVNKGEIIISGIIQNNEDVKGYVHAKGKVYGEVWYNTKVEYPLNYYEKKYTNNNKNSMYIRIGEKYIEKKNYKKFNREKLFNINNRLIPFEVGFEKQNEIKIIKQNLSLKEAKNKAIIKAKEELLKKFSTEEYIINEKTLNFYEKNSKIILEIFFSCYEEIGKEENIIE